MKRFTYLLLCLSVVTSNAYARRVVKRFDLLQDATREMFKIPKFTANMAWGKSGVALDELITYLHNHDPKIYRLYDSENGLRAQLGKAIREEMQGDVFGLRINVGSNKMVMKYFSGKAPDLKAIIADIVATDKVDADKFRGKMEWGKEGLSMDDIVAEVSRDHPDVLKLYKEASHKKNELGLRAALGMVLDAEMQGHVFSLSNHVDGKQVSKLKYFSGKAPDLKAIIADIVATDKVDADKFRGKMEWGKEGLSMDDIVAEVSRDHPDVLKLYKEASHKKNELGLRAALGMVLDAEMQGDVFRLKHDVDGKHVSKYFLGKAPDLMGIIADIVAIDKFSAKMEWGKEGLSMDDIVAEVSRDHLDVLKLYEGASPNKTERGLRSALGMALEEEMQDDFFRLKHDVDGKQVSEWKYFLGKAPDLRGIIAGIVDTDKVDADKFRGKMEWGKEGLSMDDIVAEVSRYHPAVRKLYVGFSANKTERGLRSALGMALEEEMQDDFFSLLSRVDGKQVSKYFLGKAPDLMGIIADIVAIDKFSAKMEWGKEGLSMDDIMTAVSRDHLDVLKLYKGASHNDNELGLRVALGKVLSSIDRVVLHDQRYFWKRKK